MVSYSIIMIYERKVFCMLNVDISNIWCSVSLPNLLESEREIAGAHAALMDSKDADFLSWLDEDLTEETARIAETAGAIREMAEVLVVVGSDSAILGVRAALDLLCGQYRRLRSGHEILFVGSDFSTQAWLVLTELLEGRDFCVQVIGRSGDSIETAAAVRSLRWMLERRYGTEKARERMFITTDPLKGFLRQLSAEEGYTAFNLPRTLAGHASPLAPGAMLSLAVANINIRKILEGAAEERTATAIRSFENPAWLYAAGRTILSRAGKRVEYLSTAEPDALNLCRCWQQLFGRRGCLGGDGLIPTVAEIPADVKQIHELLSDGMEPVVQTVLRFSPPAQKMAVEMDWKDLDGLNALEGFTLDYIQEQAIAGVIQAGIDGGVPIITVDCGEICAKTVGQLLYFFELASCLCAGMLGRDLYEDEPPAAYMKHMKRLLGKREI